MKKLLGLILIFVLIACVNSGNGITVSIVNSSDHAIHNVEFSTDENTFLKFDHIPAKGGVKAFLDMSNNHKGDGAYVIEFERMDGKREHKVGGYYTNGAALNRYVLCTVEKDSILMTFENLEY